MLWHIADSTPIDAIDATNLSLLNGGHSVMIQPDNVYPDFVTTAGYFSIHARHAGRINAVMGDAHAESFLPQQVRYNNTTAAKNTFWFPRYTGTSLGWW